MFNLKVKDMNKTDQQKNDIYIDYWTEQGKNAKKVLQDMKIKHVTIFIDKKGNERKIVTFKHPTLKDLTFEIGTPKNKGLTEEQKKERFENASYSDAHNKLVNSMFITKNTLKQQTLKAKHENNIEHILFKKNIHRLMNYKRYYRDNASNIVVVQMRDHNDKVYDYATIPSKKSLEELRKDGTEMAHLFSRTIKDFAGIEIWEAKEYALKPTGQGKYRYLIFKDQGVYGLAA